MGQVRPRIGRILESNTQKFWPEHLRKGRLQVLKLERENLKRRGEDLNKGKQKKMKLNSMWKKAKGAGDMKTHFERSESHFPTDIDENERYDYDVQVVRLFH
jgi:hypothetical protein